MSSILVGDTMVPIIVILGDYIRLRYWGSGGEFKISGFGRRV